MSWTFSTYLLPSFLAGAVSAAVAVLAWEHRSERTAGPFVVLMLGLAWWAVAYGVELGFSDVSHILLWDKIAFVGSVVVPAAFAWLAVEYAGLDDDMPAWAPALLAVEPVVTLALVWAYPGSRLVWESVAVRESGVFTLPVIDFGPWYWVNYAYSICLIGAALLVMAYVFGRGSRIYRRQSALLVLGAVVPLSANLLYNVVPGLSPFPHIDLTTFAMAFTGTVYALGLFRFKMLDLAPVARVMLLSEVGDGFVVVDTAGSLAEGNDVGRRIVERRREQFGTPPIPHDRLERLHGTVVSVRLDGKARSFEIRSEPVTDFRDERVGTLVVFRDITELEVVRQHDQRLAVMNRVLRHNIRNDVNVIQGYADTLADSLSGEERLYAELVSRKASRLASIGEKARHVNTEFEAPRPRTPVEVAPLLEPVVEGVAVRYPAATVSLVGDRSARAMLADGGVLETAVEYLLENAVEHHDRDRPTVTVTVDTDGSEVTVAVADDGPGIPSFEREVLTRGDETPLEHGSGLGLWVVYWLVSDSDGRLSFAENDPRGSVVTVHLPRPV